MRYERRSVTVGRVSDVLEEGVLVINVFTICEGKYVMDVPDRVDDETCSLEMSATDILATDDSSVAKFPSPCNRGGAATFVPI